MSDIDLMVDAEPDFSFWANFGLNCMGFDQFGKTC